MTIVALQFFVFALKRKIGIALVIECAFLPIAFAMTVLTFTTVSPFMNVIVFVASVAFGWR
jgi:hypothetical protein